MAVFAWLLVLFLLAVWLPSPTSAYYSQICVAGKLVEVIPLATNTNTTTDTEITDGSNQTGDVVYGILKNTTTTEKDDDNDGVLTNNDTANSTLEPFWYRECICPRATSSQHLCTKESRWCGIPINLSAPTLCFQEDTSIMVIRNIWPLVCLWYLCFLLLLFCTFKGRHALTYVINRCCPRTNHQIAERILQHRQRQQQHHLQMWNLWGDRPSREDNITTAEAGGTGSSDPTAGTELVLKTKAFQSPPSTTLVVDDNEEDDPTTSCTICFVTLDDGDRIGDLACRHVYHVDCLKGWVQRKNTCPLCAVPICQPRVKRRRNDNGEDEIGHGEDEAVNTV